MKLLIVDDEELTRTGVISSIDWKALGIEEVLQADDGINGLEMAKRHRPEIILCDVRMPRMTGIAMLERLEKILPDTIPIFMSGYSDKDYLKAAIKLKAVNYMEKPLNPTEIREAVLEAIELYTKKIRSHRGETLQSMENASRLAQLLTTPGMDSLQAAEQLAEELALPCGPGTQVTCVIIRLRTAPEFVQPSPEEIYHGFHNLLQHYHWYILSSARILFLHLWHQISRNFWKNSLAPMKIILLLWAKATMDFPRHIRLIPLP